MAALDDEEMADRPGVSAANLAQVPIRPKYESVDFSGSVFIVSSEGEVLKLPIPTKSAQDPLNWSKWKQARAFLALYIFAISADVLAQGSSYLVDQFRDDFSIPVRHLIQSPRG